MPTMKRLVLVIAVPLLLLVLAGCGSGGGQKAAKVGDSVAYVNQLCSSLGTYMKSTESQGRQLGAQLGSGTSPARTEQVLGGYVGAMIANSRRVISDLRAAGTPNVHNGDEVAAAVLATFQRIESFARTWRSQLSGLSGTNIAAAQAAAGRVLASMASLAPVGATMERSLRSPELQRAMAQSPACRTAFRAA